MSTPLYLEDIAVGQTFVTGTVEVELEKAKAFATEFDPQPFHLDAVAARASMFGGMTRPMAFSRATVSLGAKKA